MKWNEFVKRLEYAATECETLYIKGCFGAPMNDKNKVRYTNNYDYNKKPERKEKILNASASTFGFDCVCLGKGVLWDWCGDVNAEYGGANYCSNGVPDLDEKDLFEKCYDKSTDFSSIIPAEMVWIDGHCGYYIGNGRVVEATNRWADGVQITKIDNVPTPFTSEKHRSWTKHGKLPYIDYTSSATTIEELAKEVYRSVDNLVNAVLSGKDKTNLELAFEVCEGKWGNGDERKIALTKAGYDYNKVQSLVNKILK